MPVVSRRLCALLALLPVVALAGPFRFTTIDIGQGDGAVVVSPSGCAALLDGGPTGSGAAIKAYLKSIGVTQVDFAIMSHHHADHLGGIDEVDVGTDAVPIAAVYDRGGSYSSTAFSQYASHFSGKRNTVSVGQVINLCSEVQFQVVAVNGNGVNYGDENAYSVTVKITWGELNAVVGGDLTGDAASGKDMESRIASAVGLVELYKVHHHGSRYSSNSNFLNTILPKVSFFSVGFDNTYGHPTQAAKDRIAATGSAMWQTEDPATQRKLGHIELTSTDGYTFTVRQGTNTVTYTGHTPPDSQPPTAPSNLTATAPAYNQVDLTWTASTDNVGVTSYQINRSTSGGSYVSAGTSTTTGFADLGLSGSTTYSYQVTARDAAGNVSPASNTATVTTPAAPPPPPTSVTVTAPNGGESWAGGTARNITWTSSGVSNVAIDYSLDGGGAWTAITSSTPASSGSYSWTVPNSPSTNARVRVRDTVAGGSSDISDASFTITASSPAVVFLNEVLANEPGSSTAGEMVEVLNTGGQSISIAGWTLRSGTGSGTIRHTFASGTTLAPRQVIAVFAQASGIPSGTPNAIVSSTGSLGLTNSGQTVSLRNASGTTISTVTYGSSLAGQDGVSMNRSPDASSTGTWVLHNTLSSLKSSPGRNVNGGAF